MLFDETKNKKKKDILCVLHCMFFKKHFKRQNFLIINKIKNSNLFLIELLDKVGGLSLKKVHLKSAYNIILRVLDVHVLALMKHCASCLVILVKNILTISKNCLRDD